MIESHVTYSDTLDIEPSLADYVRSGEDLTELFTEAFNKLLDDVVDRGLLLRRLCKRLSLQTSVAATANVTGTATDEDFAQRRRCVIITTANTGSNVFTLKGSDDEDTWTTIQATTITTATTTTFKFSPVYKYYRLDLTIATSSTYSAYLVETSYEEAHQLRFLYMAFNKLRYRAGDDNFQQKYLDYKEDYTKKMNDMRYYYDDADDGEISEDEDETSGTVRLSRG